jgi:hypothetical protein
MAHAILGVELGAGRDEAAPAATPAGTWCGRRAAQGMEAWRRLGPAG